MQRCYNTNLFVQHSVKRAPVYSQRPSVLAPDHSVPHTGLPIGPQCGSRTLLQSIHSTASTSPSPGFTATSPTSRPSVSSLLPTRQHPALRPPCNPRSFTSSSQLLAHHFDTHKFVRRLEMEGLNRQQAEGIMNAIESVMDESIRNMSSGFVTKAAQEKVTYTLSFPK